MCTDEVGSGLVLWNFTYGSTTKTHMSVSSVVIAWKGQTERVCGGCHSDASKHRSHCSLPTPSWLDRRVLLV